MSIIRDSEKHPRGNLSVQGSSFHYCKPREDYSDLTMYDAVEVGMYGPGDMGLCRPSDLLNPLAKRLPFLPRTREARALDKLFEDGPCPVAGYVGWDDVIRLRRFLS